MSPCISAFALGGALLAFIAYFWWRGSDNVSKAHRRVRDGALLLDADSPDAFAVGHIEGAVNIPVEEVARRQEEVGPRERRIVVYARTGHTSARAAHLLRSIGYHSVLNLGPMKRWVTEPLARGGS